MRCEKFFAIFFFLFLLTATDGRAQEANLQPWVNKAFQTLSEACAKREPCREDVLMFHQQLKDPAYEKTYSHSGYGSDRCDSLEVMTPSGYRLVACRVENDGGNRGFMEYSLKKTGYPRLTVRRDLDTSPYCLHLSCVGEPMYGGKYSLGRVILRLSKSSSPASLDIRDFKESAESRGRYELLSGHKLKDQIVQRNDGQEDITFFYYDGETFGQLQPNPDRESPYEYLGDVTLYEDFPFSVKCDAYYAKE